MGPFGQVPAEERVLGEGRGHPIEIVGVATTRDEDGLAKSSRNGYLTAEQRSVAPLLNQTLKDCREAIA